MLRLAREGVRPGPHPVPGDARRHRAQLPRGAGLPGPAGRRARRPADRRQRAGGAGQRPGAGAGPTARATGSRRRCCSTRWRSTASTPLFGGARRDEEKARAKERVFSFRDEFGQWDPKNQRPELWSLYNGRHPPGRVDPGVPAVQLDRAGRLALHRRARASRCPSIYYAARARGGRPRRHALRGQRVLPAPAGEEPFRGAGALPHGRRRHLHRRRPSPTPTRSRRSSRRSRPPGSPSAARPGATTGSARPPWRTASGRATSDDDRELPGRVRHRRARSTTASPR